ncbi:MAG: phage holin family protein [Myxococcota bacterium]
MWKLLIKLLVNAAAIWAAAGIVPGMSLDTGQPLSILLVALVFGIVNALLKPLLTLLGLPFIIVTLGFFLLVINAALLGLTAGLTDALSISGFWAAVFGGICVSVVSWFLELFLPVEEEDES